MAQWQATWTFNNVMHNRHGATGSMTVTANSAEQARSIIRDEASRELFGTTGMQTYVSVSNLAEQKRFW